MKRLTNLVALPVLLVLLIVGPARADVRPVVQGSLLGVGLTYPLIDEGSLLQVGGGARFGQHLGFTGGTALFLGRGTTVWPIPLTATLFWDFNPEQVWSRHFGYLRVAWCPSSVSIDDTDWWRGWILSVGTSYTLWYCVTPHFELDWMVPRDIGSGLGATLGVNLGGTYVIQHREPEDE
jgi:hypothetical protein